ncbi:MAG: tetratricopeptide repeat protein [Cyclonatronaceae bacterium]
MYTLTIILMMFLSHVSSPDERGAEEKPAEVKFELLLSDAVRAFYHADWAYSDSLLVELTGMQPNDARVHFFRSMIPFWSYFFGGNDAEHAGRFLELSERAIMASEKRLKNAPSDTSMVLLLSGLYGYRSLVAADQKEYRTAIRSGMTGFTYTRQLLSLNTDDPNALLGRGVFDYMTGSVPRELRWMTNMFGLSGSKEEGFRRLEEAAASNSYVSNDARMFLCYLYDRDERYHDALRVSRTLTGDFPENAIFRYYYAHSLEKTGDVAGAIDSYKMVLDMQNPELESLREKASDRIVELGN